MKIAYLHGLESSIDQKDPKIIFLNKNFKEVYTPSIDYRKKSTFNELFSYIKRMQPDVIVGSSMGGYVSYLIGGKLGIETILFNPAVSGRSFDPIVDDTKLKKAKHNINLGSNDNVIIGNDVREFFKDKGVGNFTYDSYKGGHRVPADVFINTIKKTTNILEIYIKIPKNTNKMKPIKLYEEFISEKREDVGKYNTVKKAMKAIKKEYGPTPTVQSVASFINDNYYDVTEVERGDDDPRANDKIADLISTYKFDIEEWEIAWTDAQNESVVTEALAPGSKIEKNLNKALKANINMFGDNDETIKVLDTPVRIERSQYDKEMNGRSKNFGASIMYMYGSRTNEYDTSAVIGVISRTKGTAKVFLYSEETYNQFAKGASFKEYEGASVLEEFQNKTRDIVSHLSKFPADGSANESIVTEAKPAGLSKKETLKVAQKFAAALTKLDGMKYTVSSDYEEDSFDLDIEDQDDVDPRTTGEYAGGSYNINADGSVVNMAVWNKKNSSPVYGNMDDDIKTIIKTIKNIKESLVTEASKDRMIKQIERALKDGLSIFKLPMATQNYYRKNKSDFESLTEAKLSVIHKAAKKGSYPVSIVVIRDGEVIAQELVKTPAAVPAAFNVIQSYHKHKGATVHIESKTGERLFTESVVNEAENYITDGFKVGDKIKTGFGEWEVIETDYAPKKSFVAPFIFKGKDMKKVNIPNPPKTNKNAVGYKVTDGDKYPIIGFLYQYKDITKLATVGVDESVTESVFAFKPDNIEQLHFETDPKTAEEMKIELGKKQGEVSKRKQIESGEYSLRRFRKEIGYGNGKDVGVFLPGSYDASVSKLGDGPHKKAVKAVKWNQKKYDQWLEDMASNGGAENAFDMAQNANNEPGLINWVKKEFRGDDPLQRIQWDIEGYAESVITESETVYHKYDFEGMWAQKLGMTREEYVAHFATMTVGIDEAKVKDSSGKKFEPKGVSFTYTDRGRFYGVYLYDVAKTSNVQWKAKLRSMEEVTEFLALNDIDLQIPSRYDEKELDVICKQLSKKGIVCDYNDAMDVS